MMAGWELARLKDTGAAKIVKAESVSKEERRLISLVRSAKVKEGNEH
ncbi:hypothetical protein MKY25_15030 [Geobacillus sp. FSL W8-0032]|uniref:Uncharacterized protein n=1 Tax=Geobacillus icigianus TaxID=1430331 RepID=A0ABU6BH38_9BACL|nr:hypothetical protein [Geobacillus icigianus]MEB3751306.1 hypothetical protein [Geobacillus icigianus]